METSEDPTSPAPASREVCERLFTEAADRALLYVRLRLGAGLRERVDSMDVLQEAYVEALRSFPSFEERGEGSFVHWFCRIVENRLRKLAERGEALKRRAPGRAVPVSRAIEELRASEASPATEAGRAESRERLARAIEGLEPDEREALLHRYFEGRTIEDLSLIHI